MLTFKDDQLRAKLKESAPAAAAPLVDGIAFLPFPDLGWSEYLLSTTSGSFH